MRKRATKAALMLICLILMAGCTSPSDAIPVWEPATPRPTIHTDGIEELPAEHIADAVTEAVIKADSVHMTGTYREPVPIDDTGRPIEPPPTPSRTVTFDVVGTPQRLHATLSIDDLALELHREGDSVLAHGNSQAASTLGVASLADEWLQYAAEDEWLQPWLALTDAAALVRSVLHPDSTTTISVGPVTPETPPLLQLDVASSGKAAGTVTIRAVGDPLPHTIALSDASGSGEISFTEWGAAIPPAMPDSVRRAGEVALPQR